MGYVDTKHPVVVRNLRLFAEDHEQVVDLLKLVLEERHDEAFGILFDMLEECAEDG